MGKLVRLIARLDVKGENLIKGVHLEGLRVLGSPQAYAEKYYRTGADEIIYMDLVASLYGRSHLADIVRKTAANVFVPLTGGGGILISIFTTNESTFGGGRKLPLPTLRRFSTLANS